MDISLATTGKLAFEPRFPFPALGAMVRAFRARQAERLTIRELDAVPQATLRDIGMTRPQVFARVHGNLSAACP